VAGSQLGCGVMAGSGALIVPWGGIPEGGKVG